MSAIRVVESSGSLGAVQVADGSGGFLSGSLIAGTNITINDDGNGNFTFNGQAGGSGTIGEAEDGDYTDGLFKDFTTTTPVGTAVDRFNEILSLLAPAPAPDLDDIDNDNTGAVSVELSFGSSNDLTGSTPAYYSVGTTAGFSALDVNDTYSAATSGNNIRIGAFGSLRNIIGTLNEDVTQDPSGTGNNYPNNAFGNADQGELRLEINGEVIHTTNLTTFSSGDTNATGSCFTSVLTASAGTLDNGTSFENFKHRTGGYKIVTGDQRQGWNYARVLHVIGSTTHETNYVEWLNDTNSDALSAAGNNLEFEGSGSIHLSGVEYFQSGSAEYVTRVSNAYRNVYDTDAIRFPTSNAGSIRSGVSFTISNQSKPDIDTAGGEDHTKVLHLTGSGNVTADYMLDGSITAGITVTHPLKSDLTNGGQSTASGILLYNLANNSNNQRETFRRENFRLISGSYNTQSSLTDSSNVWDSEVFMTASNGAHSNGLQFFNQRLYSPINSLNSGDFSSFSNGPSENPDYSGETGQRTFYRWFRNETGSTQHDLTINIQGSSTTIVPASTSLNSGRIRVFVKFPNNGDRETGWLDLATEFVLDAYSDNDGAHTANGSLSFDNSLDANNFVTLGTVGILDDEYIGIRIEADTSWSGYISQIDVTFGAGTGTISAVPDLDDMDCNNTGVTAKLSFGPTKSITDYTNVGTTAGFSAIGLNGTYQVEANSNNLRRGVFDRTTTIEGDLNEDISAVSPDYVANSFSDANSGSLVLEVNGSDLHTVELTGSYNLVGAGEPGSGTGTSLTGNSGFFDLSVWKPAEYDNDVPYYLEIYRTGKYRVHTNDQRDGWNYARVKHVGSWGTRTTNYVEWVNDISGSTNDISDAGSTITQFGDDDIFHLSGVKYFVDPTGSIETRISNLYRNVFSDSSSAISLTSLTNANAVSIVQSGLGITSTRTENDGASPLQNLNTNAGSQNEVLHVTGTIQFSQSTSLSGAFTSDTGTSQYNCGGVLTFVHPLKDNHSISAQTATNLLVYSASDNSTHDNEYFNGEQYRIQSGSYTSQNSITDSSNEWDSTTSINDASESGFVKGLMVYDGLLMSPIKGGNSGDFRNHNAGGVFEGPDNNVNYSTLTEVSREYFRYFENSSNNDLARFGITIYGDATIVSRATSKGTDKNCTVELKCPGKNEFVDLAVDFTVGAGGTPGQEGDGCLSGTLDATIDGSGAANEVNFGTFSVLGQTSGPDAIVVRITANKEWTGYISQIDIRWSVS